jgi:hypothetical protein
MGSTEKRASKRISFLCDVVCEGGEARLQQTRINDLSTDGAFVDSIINYAEGSTLKLTFNIRSAVITVSAEVRYCMPGIGVGVRFLDLTPEQREAIAAAVAEQSK